MPEQKTCKQCNEQFTIEDEDLEFYKKISPTIGENTYEWPAPTLCPRCRVMRRMSWRNERKVYKRKSDKSGKEIISIYAPDKTDYKVLSVDEWWSDDWDAMSYGRDYDPDKKFFEQLKDLIKDVPRLALYNSNTQGCEYSNFIAECKNCYMSSVVYYGCENTHFSYLTFGSKDNVDVSFCDKVENCYELVDGTNCFDCRYSNRLENCRNCYFSQDLIGCSDCILCNNLRNKQYCIENKQLTKEEYESKLSEIDLGSRNVIDEYLGKYRKLREDSVVKFANIVNCEDCQGDNLKNCKNVKKCFSSTRVENARYSFDQEQGKNIYDCEGGEYEWMVEVNHTGFGSNCMGCSSVLYSNFMYYCENCHNSRDCFGCVGLRNKQYCIFNKQYTKEEYEKKVGEIIERMKADGEWGEFLPMSLSPFGYNETLANDNFTMTKEEAGKLGAKWQDNEYLPEFSGQYYEPDDNIKTYQNKEKSDELIAGVIKCQVSGKPFKIMPQELAFYLKNGIPIPNKHYNVRFMDRFRTRNPKKLHHRQCMCEESGHDHEGRCKNEFETTYAPDRPEKVYCESCYQKSAI